MVQDHRRNWRRNHYVYPVISRRARGLSIGVNLNPDKVCNFNCVYCEVNRRSPAVQRRVDLGLLRQELDAMLDLALGGELWLDPYFVAVPAELRRLNDIAFSGDGEPTTLPNFAQAVQAVADAKAARGLRDVKIVLISNATRFHTQAFAQAVPILQANNGEVWAKLDAGTEPHYRAVNRSGVPFAQVLQNITQLARTMPIVIQSMFLVLDGQPPAPAELEAYVGRLRDILAAGGQIKHIQVYTVARPPATAVASALSDSELDAIARRIAQAILEVPVQTYYGADVPPQQ